MFENPRRGRQARNFTTNVPKVLDLKSSSEQIFSRKLSLGAPVLVTATDVLTTCAEVINRVNTLLHFAVSLMMTSVNVVEFMTPKSPLE